MKRVQLWGLILLLFSIASCRKDFQDVKGVKMLFQLQFPDNFDKDSKAKDIPLSIKNNITGEIFSLTSDVNGVVEVELIPGTYTLAASKTYTPEEALALSGYEVESFVNATVSPVIVSQDAQVDIPLKASTAGGLIIREFYYAGVPSFYFYDAFVEIYNNSNVEQRVDSLFMGNTRSGATNNTGSTAKYGFLSSTTDSVYLSNIFMVPSTGTPKYLQPGESLVIAMDGINHKSDPKGNANSPVNLGAGIADYEVYWQYSTSDLDAADVPNMILSYLNSTGGVDWLPGSFGTGLVIFRVDNLDELPVAKEPGATSANQFKAIPVSNVLDAVDAVANSAILPANKRLPITLDAGMTTVGATYNGKSVRRKVKSVINDKTIFMDTNNSSNDFEINNSPSPRKWN